LGEGVIERADGHPPLREDDANIWLKINSSLITGENPYAYTDCDVERGVTYEYQLSAVLDVSGLASGVYTLRASSAGAEVSERAVVVR